MAPRSDRSGRAALVEDPRERILDAAYELFASIGVNQAGVDTIAVQSGCSKQSLYNHYGSKANLAVAFLDRRESLWTRGFVEAEVLKHQEPADALLSIFDLFDGWFRKSDFEGCSFINVLLESEIDGQVHQAATDHLAKVREIVRTLAVAAGFEGPDNFAQAWHMLMKGSIVSACEGNKNAAQQAKRVAQLMIDGWPRD